MPSSIILTLDPANITSLAQTIDRESQGTYAGTDFLDPVFEFATPEDYLSYLQQLAAPTRGALTIERIDELFHRAAGLPHGALAPHRNLRNQVLERFNQKFLYGGDRVSLSQYGADAPKATMLARHYLLSHVLYGDVVLPTGIRSEQRREVYYTAAALALYGDFHPEGVECITKPKDAVIAHKIIDLLRRNEFKTVDDHRDLAEKLLRIYSLREIARSHPPMGEEYFSCAQDRNPIFVEVVNGQFNQACIQAALEYYDIHE